MPEGVPCEDLMMDNAVAAEILREHIATVRPAISDAVEAALNDAVRVLEDGERNVYTREEVETLEDWFTVRGSVAAYYETKGALRPEACIAYSLHGGVLYINDGVDRQRLSLEDYGKYWWLYRRYPSEDQRRGRELQQ